MTSLQHNSNKQQSNTHKSKNMSTPANIPKRNFRETHFLSAKAREQLQNETCNISAQNLFLRDLMPIVRKSAAAANVEGDAGDLKQFSQAALNAVFRDSHTWFAQMSQDERNGYSERAFCEREAKRQKREERLDEVNHKLMARREHLEMAASDHSWTRTSACTLSDEFVANMLERYESDDPKYRRTQYLPPCLHPA